MVNQGAAVHIVIPNYNGIEFLPACLASIEGQNYSSCEVTVVDNGSSDGSLEYLRTSHPRVRCIALPENRGFSAAVNAGIVESNSPYIFLLNNDTELHPECLANLVEAAERLNEYVFFAPKMISFHNRRILDGAGDGYLRGGAGYRLGTMEKDASYYDISRPVFGACAGAVLYRKKVFDMVGLFDEDFFAYLEDVDLNLRMNRAGMRGYYVSEAKVYHIGSATTGSKINSFTVRLSTRNSLYVLMKHYNISLFIRFFPVIVIYQFCWFLFVLKKGQLLPYAQGGVDMLKKAKEMRKKHRMILHTDKVSTACFASSLTKAEKTVIKSIMRRRQEQGKGIRLLRLYSFLFL